MAQFFVNLVNGDAEGLSSCHQSQPSWLQNTEANKGVSSYHLTQAKAKLGKAKKSGHIRNQDLKVQVQLNSLCSCGHIFRGFSLYRDPKITCSCWIRPAAAHTAAGQPPWQHTLKSAHLASHKVNGELCKGERKPVHLSMKVKNASFYQSAPHN